MSRKLHSVVVALILALVATTSAQAKSYRTVHLSPAATIGYVFGAQASIARCFAYRESRLEPWATHYNSNGTIDRGLFQINSVWVGHIVQWYERGHGVRVRIDASRLYGALYNARVAWAISRGGVYWAAWGYAC